MDGKASGRMCSWRSLHAAVIVFRHLYVVMGHILQVTKFPSHLNCMHTLCDMICMQESY